MAIQRGNVISVLGTTPDSKKLDEIFYFLCLLSFRALFSMVSHGQTVGPRSNVKVSMESLVNGLSCSQSGKMV